MMVGGGGGGGEKISPTLFCEKPDDNDKHDESIVKLINPVVAILFLWRKCKSLRCRNSCCKESSRYKVKDKTVLATGCTRLF
jgi:hypothetical protein